MEKRKSGDLIPGRDVLGHVDEGDHPGEVFKNPQYTEILATGLTEFLKTGQYADITLIAEQQEFRCHKMVLAMSSPYFDKMFSSGLLESQQEKVELREMSSDTLEAIIKYIYTGRVYLREQNVQAIFEAANLFQIGSLCDGCADFLSKHLDDSNCLGVMKLGDALSHQNLYMKARMFTLKRFSAVQKGEEFLQLSSPELSDLITDSDLEVPSEEFVCMSALKWLEHSPESRLKHVSNILGRVRFNYLSLNFIINALENNPHLQKDRPCLQVLESHKNNLILGLSSHPTSAFPRLSTNTERVMIIVGGEKKTGDRLTQVIAVSLQRAGAFQVLKEFPSEENVEHAACTVGNNVYVSGGYQLWQYQTGSNKWVRQAPMSKRRRRHAMVSMGEKIFVLGGYHDPTKSTLVTIDEYDVKTDTWTYIGDLVEPVRSAACSTYKHYIYVFGGTDKEGHAVGIVQKFNTVTRVCTLCKAMPEPCRLGRAIVGVDTIYIFGQKCYAYTPSQDSWAINEKLLKGKTCKFAGAHWESNKLFLVAGKNGENYTDRVEYLETNDKSDWVCLTTLPEAQLVFAYAVVTRKTMEPHHATAPSELRSIITVPSHNLSPSRASRSGSSEPDDTESSDE